MKDKLITVDFISKGKHTEIAATAGDNFVSTTAVQMKRAFLSLLLGLGTLAQSTSATTVTIDQADANVFAFTLTWGENITTPGTVVLSLIPPVASFPELRAFGLIAVDVRESDFMDFKLFGINPSTALFDPIVDWFIFRFASASDRSFANATLEDHGPLPPSSVSATSDGFGAHLIYGKIPIPDGGSGFLQLGVALLGCVAVRNRLGRVSF